MRQSSSQVISPVSAAAPILLHPVLQAALENLDVQLEEELTRYRRHQRLQPILQRQRLGIATAKPAQNQTVQLPQFPASATVASSDALPVQPPAQPPAQSSGAMIDSQSDRVTPNDAALTSQEWRSSSNAPLTVLPVASEGDSLQSIPSPDLEATVPDDYFASTEELLRSIAEETPEQRTEPQPGRLLDTLLTPLGIGSLILLLLSTATLGYLVMNPTSLGFLTAQKPNDNSSSVTPSPTVNSPTLQEDAPSPNLAAKEFVDLNLRTLSTLPKPSPANAPKPAPSPSPQAAKPPEPIVPPTTDPGNLPPVVVPPAPAIVPSAPASNPRPAASSPVRSAPAPASTPSESRPQPIPERSSESVPAPVSQPSSPASRAESRTPEVVANPSPTRSNYLVVTPYRSDSELDQVQQAVPDAYVRNFSDGAQVQMGAFSDQSKAQELVQELQQQGIEAEVRER
ncbi:SPOR domain-containing protein [Leptolyngbya ohadii]|uniref:SPOR domain-containing protein n=1 Tax=Leptolyngbya ohadii TaxID=1962290 RepID=UPI000B59F70E|nr:SPOR domain-containing protein [Leptolyngbya ohadii]